MLFLILKLARMIKAMKKLLETDLTKQFTLTKVNTV